MKGRSPQPASPTGSVSAWDWAGVALVSACAAFAGLLEALLVPLYVGSVIVPVAVLLALASNVALPRLARSLVPKTIAAIAPFGAWLIVMIGFGALSRPEGDVILPGAPASVEFVTYAVLLGGALVGTATIVWLTPPPAQRPPTKQPPTR